LIMAGKIETDLRTGLYYYIEASYDEYKSRTLIVKTVAECSPTVNAAPLKRLKVPPLSNARRTAGFDLCPIQFEAKSRHLLSRCFRRLPRMLMDCGPLNRTGNNAVTPIAYDVASNLTPVVLIKYVVIHKVDRNPGRGERSLPIKYVIKSEWARSFFGPLPRAFSSFPVPTR
jgi:hypothetical protein